VRIGRRLYADGGLYAVSPDQIALHELEHFMEVAPARISMLSIGIDVATPKAAEVLRALARKTASKCRSVRVGGIHELAPCIAAP
jgi:hypothetical protein